MYANASHEYRADIAGLRAVAVLPILLFHAGLGALGGGFVGVDVFFVISGFLITRIIVRDLGSDRFSIMEFYRRRVARIFPALALVLTATLIAGAALMLPREARDLGMSSVAAAAFVSNFHFMLTTDYFGGAAEYKPLLHTWSLAVEEQFYVFYPILVLAVWKWARRWLTAIIGALCLASFGLALVVGQIAPEAAFYMFPTRAWELGVGALVALGAAPSGLRDRVKHALAMVGLALIVIGVLTIRPDALFPAPSALLPVMGAALLIAYGQTGPTAALLSWRPMVWVGDISYSLYLWHWPIITLYRLQTGVELDGVETVALVAASIIAAALTRVALEEPARRRLAALPRLPVVFGGVAALAAVAGASWASSERPVRLRPAPAEVERLASVVDYRQTPDYARQFRRGVCFWGTGDGRRYDPGCLEAAPGRENWVVFGDSHAAQYWRALQEYWPQRHVIQATASGCRPLLETEGAALCTGLADHVFRDVLRPERTAGVVFAGQWREDEVPELVRTVREVRRRGLAVVVIGPTVEYDGDFPLILARATLMGEADVPSHRRLARRRDLDAAMRATFSEIDATYVSAWQAECPEDRCTLLDDKGLPLHFDYGHLTLDGARMMVRRFGSQLP